MKLGSLCSGGGGLDMAVEAVFGAETVWHCELDAAASKVLAHRWPGVPNHGDLINTDWSSVEPVDIMCFGWPCQPFSLAGKRKGHEDERAIWPHIADAVRILRPRICVMENVSAVLGSEFQRVADGMAALGYDLRWTCLRASDVGAPHRRERLFVVATDTDDGEPNQREGSDWPTYGWAAARRSQLWAGGCGGDAAYASGDGWHEGRPESVGFVGGSDAAVSGDGPVNLLPTPVVTDSFGARNSTSGRSNPNSQHHSGDTLTDVMWKLLPTPNAQDGNGGGRYSSEGHQSTLPGEVRLFPTPCSRDFKDATASPGAVARNTPSLGAIDHYLPPPAAADGNRGQDLARANREGSGGDDLVTLAVKADRDHQWGKYGKYAPAIKRWEQVLGRPAPNPTESNRNGNPRLNPEFSSWMMGWPAGWVTDVPGITRNDKLRIIGNGVVPQQAAAALQWLLSLEAVA